MVGYHVRVGVLYQPAFGHLAFVSTRCGGSLSEYDVYHASAGIDEAALWVVREDGSSVWRRLGVASTSLPHPLYLPLSLRGGSGTENLSVMLDRSSASWSDSWIYGDWDGCLRRVFRTSKRPGVYESMKLHGQTDPVLWLSCTSTSSLSTFSWSKL